MSPPATHKKRPALRTRLLALGILFAVLVPTIAFARTDNPIDSAILNIFSSNPSVGDGNWCATYRLPGKELETKCFSSKTSCDYRTNLAKQPAQRGQNPGVVTAECFDKSKTSAESLSPGQQRAAEKSVEEGRRKAAAAANEEDNLFPWAIGPLKVIPMLFAGIAFLVFKVAGIYLTTMAHIMDWSISVSIDSQVIANAQFVNIGWTAVRDFANMFFIFGLLYIAIQTILGLSGGGTKRALVHFVIAALLINFSLFMTEIVIDAGNILAVSIWSKIKTQQGPITLSGASSKILGGLDLQTLFASNQDLTFKSKEGSYSYGKMFLIYSGGAAFMFIAGYVFLAGALMMITRIVMLFLLMIFSPFAFMSYGLPKLEQYWDKWVDKLLKQVFVAPFFIFMLYLNAVVVDKFDLFAISGSKGQTFFGAFTGSGEYQIIFNFVLMIAFLIASLHIAESYAGEVGSHARGWAKSASRWAGGVATGAAVSGGAWAMRQGLGKIGMMGKDNAKLHEMAAQKGWRGMVGRGAITVSGGMARATYDPRGTKFGKNVLSGFGGIDIGEAGGKGGREATGSILGATRGIDLLNKGDIGSDRVKEVLAAADLRYKNDPAGKAAFLENNLGTMFDQKSGKRVNRYLNDSELKATRESVATETRTKAAKEAVKTQPQAIKEAEAQLANYKDQRARGETVDPAEIVKTEAKLAGATKELTDALKALNGKEFGEMINEKMLTETPELMRYATRQQVAYMNANYDKFTPKMMEIANKEVMENGANEDTRQYFIQQAKLKTSMFPTDLKGELKKEVGAYKKEIATYDELTANEAAREKHFADLEKLDGKAQDILSAMSFKEVARLDDELKSDEAMVRNYTEKHFNEIENYHKNIKQDDGTNKELFTRIRENATKRGTRATREYMRKANKRDSVYFDPTAPMERKNRGNENTPALDGDDEEDNLA